MNYLFPALGCALLLAGCSADSEKRAVQAQNTPPPPPTASAVSSRGRDTVLTGQEFSTRVYVDPRVLTAIAPAESKPRTIRITYRPSLESPAYDTAVMVGDTGIVRFTPTAKNVKSGEIKAHEWMYKVELDYNERYPGPDTIFMNREILYLQGKP
ncbi:hypothetical protein [Hymenobacter sublimis]|uniref:Lipoprotein n=1 Tax=Hymenobacter sublimis TaxID=2933777 RepID=A0ABY4JFC9_9BACT|nr:hypothetical protein [Hymenobacter sublimis]UPL50492.1 hypothetical protein MWH26_06180 [Hymenobacter sublimis]